jgi:hypothetical protein
MVYNQKVYKFSSTNILEVKLPNEKCEDSEEETGVWNRS